MSKSRFTLYALALITLCFFNPTPAMAQEATAQQPSAEWQQAAREQRQPAAAAMVSPATSCAFSLAKINHHVVKEFQKAWGQTDYGRQSIEAVVLIFRLRDGSYTAKTLGITYERKKFTFQWVATTIAIVHTHPNGHDPKPSPQDMKVADKYGVPIATLTRAGMYLYDPQSKQTAKVQAGLDWHDPAKWLASSEQFAVQRAALQTTVKPITTQPSSFVGAARSAAR